MSRRLLVLLPLLVISSVASAQTYPVTDSFSDPLNTPLSSNWTSVQQDPAEFNGKIVQNAGIIQTNPSNRRAMATYTAAPFSVSSGGTSDQKVSLTFWGQANASDSSSGPCVRTDTTGNGYCYFPQNGQIAVMLSSRQPGLVNGVVGGGPNSNTAYVPNAHFGACPLGNVDDNYGHSAGQVSDGDTVSLEVVGNKLTCKDETTGKTYSVTDSQIKVGSPGIVMNEEDQVKSIRFGSFSADCVPTCNTTPVPTATPTFSPTPTGTYTTAQSLIITDLTANAAIYYTTDGSVPTSASTLYTHPISVTSTETIQAIAVAPGYLDSAVATANFVVNVPQAATPTFNAPAGAYLTAQTVAISDTTSGATIYYTTDGSTPTSTSTEYHVPITISTSVTLKAIAIKVNLASSAIQSGTYIIGTKTLSGVIVMPRGAAIQAGSTQQFTATCSYSDNTTDDCSSAGGVTWSTGSLKALSINGTGLATWAASADPGSGGASAYYVVAAAGNTTSGIFKDKALVYGQHPGDTWYQYPTPTGILTDSETGAALPVNVVVGSTVTMGAGLEINDPHVDSVGQPFQGSCNWSSSDTSIATVDNFGEITAVAPGTVSITCGEVGNAVFGNSNMPGWVAPGNVLTFHVVTGGTSNTTWYVRPDGGTLYNATTSTGQCDGKTNAAYPGTGTDQPCAVSNPRYLWSDEVSYQKLQWVISGGDTVIIAQNSDGYNVGMSAPQAGTTWFPGNCAGSGYGCFMPTVPSGSATQHTKILGANYASCRDDSAKTQLVPSFGSGTAINVTDSQFVDVACFEIMGKAGCVGGNYDNQCDGTSNTGSNGITESALTSEVTYTDVFIHGLTHDGIYGPTGVGVVANYVHTRALPNGGIDMDDNTWNSGNISVGGGFTLTNSIIEWSGCAEEYPITHTYPILECRDQNTGSYGDGFSTASTTGDWLFDHNTFRYNFQDGLDLLHSGMQKFTLTDNFSFANEGQQFKIGSGDTIITRNNIAEGNCYRIGALVGDEPASALSPGNFDGTFANGYGLCRATATMSEHFDGIGTALVQNNTILTTSGGDTPFTIACDGGWDYCPNSENVFENNLLIGYQDKSVGNSLSDQLIPGLFYLLTDQGSNNGIPVAVNGTYYMPPADGWQTRSNNIFYGVRTVDNGYKNYPDPGDPALSWCPLPGNTRLGPAFGTNETCDTQDPLFVNEPANPITAETQLDDYNFTPSGASPAIGAGVAIADITTDINGAPRANPPTIGAIEATSTTPPATSQITITVVPNPATVGTAVTFTATVTSTGSTTPTGTVTFLNNSSATLGTGVLNGSGVATFVTSTLAVGTYSVTASYPGDNKTQASVSTPAVSLTVNPVVAPPISTTTALASSLNPANVGDSVVLTATVTPASGTATMTGTVTFYSGAASLGTGTVTNGVATYTTSFATAGSYVLTAVYGGDTNFAASPASAPVTEVVNPVTAPPIATTTALASSLNPANAGDSVMLTATIAPASGTATMTGTVTFLNGGTTLGTGTVSNGVATYTTSSLPAGSNTLTATYSGDTTFSTSTSPSITEVINSLVPQSYTITPSATTITVEVGSTAQIVLATTSVNGYVGTVTFTCTPSSVTISCGVAGNPVTLAANGTGHATLTITPNGTTTSLNHPGTSFQGLSSWTYSTMALLFPGSLVGLLTLGRKRKQLRKLMLLFLLCAGFAGLVSMTGCGSGPHGPRNYTVAVTANDGVTVAQIYSIAVTIP